MFNPLSEQKFVIQFAKNTSQRRLNHQFNIFGIFILAMIIDNHKLQNLFFFVDATKNFG